jgi:hypothetical protein
MRIEGKQSNYCNLFTPSDPQLMMNSIQDLYVVKQTEALLIQKKKKRQTRAFIRLVAGFIDKCTS